MKPTLHDIEEKFQEFNRRFFNNTLPPLPLRMGNSKSSLGGLHFKKRRNNRGETVCYDFSIRISTRLDLPEEIIEDTLIHEMIHYYILHNQLKDSSPHGKLFNRLKDDINSRFGRHITVSHRYTPEEQEQDKHIKVHLICVSELTDGRTGLTLSAKTRIFEIWKELPKYFPVKRFAWYWSTDPYFNRFPNAIKPKIFIVDKAELQVHINTEQRLEQKNGMILFKKADIK